MFTGSTPNGYELPEYIFCPSAGFGSGFKLNTVTFSKSKSFLNYRINLKKKFNLI